MAGGIGPPPAPGVPALTAAPGAGTPGLRLGGDVTSVWRMLTHGTPGLPKSAAAGAVNGLSSGAVQKNPAVAMAVAAALRLVVRDMFSPFP